MRCPNQPSMRTAPGASGVSWSFAPGAGSGLSAKQPTAAAVARKVVFNVLIFRVAPVWWVRVSGVYILRLKAKGIRLRSRLSTAWIWAADPLVSTSMAASSGSRTGCPTRKGKT